MQGDPRRTVYGSRLTTWFAVSALALGAVAYSPAQQQPAGQPVSAARSVAHLAKIEAAAVTGDQQAVKEGVEALSGDLRRSMCVPDITRRIDPVKCLVRLRHHRICLT